MALRGEARVRPEQGQKATPMNVNFRLTGISPLLMHWDNVDGSDRLKAWRKTSDGKASPGGDDRYPAWTWQEYVYHDGVNVVVPAQNLMTCLRRAAADMILKGKKTYKELSQSGLIPESEFLAFEGGAGTIRYADIIAMRENTYDQQKEEVGPLGFHLFAIRASVGMSKHIRVRPRFERWSVSGSLLVISSQLTREVITEMFNKAGNVGLGDWRPGCRTPGPFGRFESKVTFK